MNLALYEMSGNEFEDFVREYNEIITSDDNSYYFPPASQDQYYRQVQQEQEYAELSAGD